jgi:N-sulfoglucosamine sulfohydrolase
MYKPEEVFVPGFLPDLPEVRTEMSHYYNSARRLDDTFGQVMKAIKESGEESNTMIIFFSDNGIAMPFAKANCYLASTQTPLFIYLPGKFKPGQDRHMLSTVDLFPTIIDITGIKKPAHLDGTSFLPLLQGKDQAGREKVFTEINYLSGGNYYPMRCVQDKQFAYIFNPWSDGETVYKNANEGQTFKAMEAKGKTDKAIQARVTLFRHRVQEELYDLQKDPGCLNNLADNNAFSRTKERYRAAMKTLMTEKGDPILAVLKLIDKPKQMRQLVDTIYQGVLKNGVGVRD